MNSLTDWRQMRCPQPTAVALGTFDGLHLGHRAVINAAVTGGLPCVVFAITPAATTGGLLTAADKQALTASLGAAYYLPVALADIRDMTAEDFFTKVLLQACRAGRICCGFNFRFGKNAAGDTALLTALCDRAGIQADVLPPVTYDGQPVSSTRIRRALEDGRPEIAAAMLGRPFHVTLPVVHGNRLGHGLGFPTINQPWPQALALPRLGVYAVTAQVEGVSYPGVCNVGVRPTVGSDRVLAETHIIGLHRELYGQTVTLRLLRFLRPEQRFDSLQALKAAIARDVEQAKTVFLQEGTNL